VNSLKSNLKKSLYSVAWNADLMPGVTSAYLPPLGNKLGNIANIIRVA
jgi:hypothetical protein